MKAGELTKRMSKAQTQQQTRILVQAAAAACEDKKGVDTRILELDPIDSGLADFFLVTSAMTDRQTVATADEHHVTQDWSFLALHSGSCSWIGRREALGPQNRHST